MFVLLVPEQATEQHLQILSELAQMFSDRDLREQLTRTQDAGGLHQIISSWQPDVTNQHSAAV
jgi:PTS system nitrogen regulatory IIA component